MIDRFTGRAAACSLLLVLAVSARGAAILTVEHADLGINYSPSLNAWQLTARDEDNSIEYAADEVILQCAEEGKLEVPSNPNFSFLGAPGDDVWILPQVQNDDLLFLGVSTENKNPANWQGVGVDAGFLVKGFLAGAFQGNTVSLRLVDVAGPGAFSAYSIGGVGGLTVHYNTRDGITAADTQSFTPGVHRHLNWAFSAPGDYYVTFQAAGTLPGAGGVTMSELTTYHFQIVPEPGSAALAVLGLGMLSLRRRRGSRNFQS